VTDDDLRTNAAALCLRGFTQEPLREPLCIAVYRQHGQTIANHPGDRVYAHARASRGRLQPQAARSTVDAATRYRRTSNLEPLAEVEGALLVVEVLHAPHPELGGLLLVGSEHFCKSDTVRAGETAGGRAETTQARRRGGTEARRRGGARHVRWLGACVRGAGTAGLPQTARAPLQKSCGSHTRRTACAVLHISHTCRRTRHRARTLVLQRAPSSITD